MTRNEREHLNKLSKEVFGKSSAWQKLYNRGEPTKVKSTFKSGQEIEVTRYEQVPLENIKTILEEKAKELVLQKELKEKQNVATGQQLELGATASGTDGGPAGSPTEGTESGSTN